MLFVMRFICSKNYRAINIGLSKERFYQLKRTLSMALSVLLVVSQLSRHTDFAYQLRFWVGFNGFGFATVIAG